MGWIQKGYSGLEKIKKEKNRKIELSIFSAHCNKKTVYFFQLIQIVRMKCLITEGGLRLSIFFNPFKFNVFHLKFKRLQWALVENKKRKLNWPYKKKKESDKSP